MAKRLTLFCALLIAGSAADISAGGIFNLTQGFLIGLEADSKHPGPCYQAIAGLSNDFEAIASDISRISKGDEAAVTQLFTDVTGTVHDIRAFNGTCDIAALEAQIKALLTPEGAKIISENYLKHVIAINRDISTVKDCSANYYNCGKAAGEIFRDIVGWNLNIVQAKLPKNNIESFINGLITGLDKNGIDTCSTSLTKLNSYANELAENIKKAVKGDTSVVPSLIINLKQVRSEHKKVMASCDFNSFIEDVKNALTPDGTKEFMMNIMLNHAKIQSFIKSFETCSANTSKCGFDLGQLVQLLLGYSI